jgi:hypothetical protein
VLWNNANGEERIFLHETPSKSTEGIITFIGHRFNTDNPNKYMARDIPLLEHEIRSRQKKEKHVHYAEPVLTLLLDGQEPKEGSVMLWDKKNRHLLSQIVTLSVLYVCMDDMSLFQIDTRE